MAARTLAVTDWDDIIMPRLSTADTSEILTAIGDIKALVAARYGDLQASVEVRYGTLQASMATLVANQSGFQRDIIAVQASLTDVRGELASIRMDKAPRRELEELGNRIAAQITEMDKQKVGADEFEAHGLLLENLGIRVDEMDKAIESRQGEMNKKLDVLSAINERKKGRDDTIKWMWGVLAALVAWAIAVGGILLKRG